MQHVDRVHTVGVTRVVQRYAVGSLEKQYRVARNAVALDRDAHAGVHECLQAVEVLLDIVRLETFYRVLGSGGYVLVNGLLEIMMIVPDKPRTAGKIEGGEPNDHHKVP